MFKFALTIINTIGRNTFPKNEYFWLTTKSYKYILETHLLVNITAILYREFELFYLVSLSDDNRTSEEHT